MILPLTLNVVNARLKDAQSRGVLMTSEYKGKVTLLHDFKCQCGHTWSTRLYKILSGQGCANCSINKRRLTSEYVNLKILEFESRGITLLGAFTESHNKHSFRCFCTHEWTTTFNTVSSGKGCPRCSKRIITDSDITIRFADFEKRGVLVLEPYKGKTNLKHKVKCLKKDCGTHWEATINNLSKGQGCPACNRTGFNIGKPAILYYLKFTYENKDYYKIGITNNTVKSRYIREKLHYEIIFTVQFDKGAEAQKRERCIIEDNREFLYKGKWFLFSGNTELFTKDVLNLDR